MRRFRCFVALWGLFAVGLLAAQVGPGVWDYWSRIEALRHDDYTEVLIAVDKQKKTTTEVRFDMVAAPGGSFFMGSPESEPNRRADEGPQHGVKIYPFWIGKCEVTWDEYELFENDAVRPPAALDGVLELILDDADAITRPSPSDGNKYCGHGKGRHPVLGITHHAAREYCRWLSKTSGKNYRLPTEAEWEYACRAGSRTAYTFGDEPTALPAYAWYVGNSAPVNAMPGTHAVGMRKANPWGLHDMVGNVMEYCLDHYEPRAYEGRSFDAFIPRPVVIPTKKKYHPVLRGGSWADSPEMLRSAARRSFDKTWRQPLSYWWNDIDVIGFRIVRPVEEQDNLKGFRSKVTRESD